MLHPAAFPPSYIPLQSPQCNVQVPIFSVLEEMVVDEDNAKSTLTQRGTYKSWESHHYELALSTCRHLFGAGWHKSGTGSKGTTKLHNKLLMVYPRVFG